MTIVGGLRSAVTVITLWLVSAAFVWSWVNINLMLTAGIMSDWTIRQALTAPLTILSHPLAPVAHLPGAASTLTGWFWLELFLAVGAVAVRAAIRLGWLSSHRLLGRSETDIPIHKRLTPNVADVGIWTPPGHRHPAASFWYFLPFTGKSPYRSDGMLVPEHVQQPADRIFVGYHIHKHPVRNRKYLVYARPEHHVAVFGPSGTGKGASQMNPSLLFSNGSAHESPDGDGKGGPGPLISSTVKNDHVDVSLEWRSALAPCYVYDPLGLYPEYRDSWCGWNPLSTIVSFNDASKVAQALMDSEQQQSSTSSGTDDYFQAQALMVLGPMLLAAATASHPFSMVYEWSMALEEESSNPDVVAEDGTVNPNSTMYAVMDSLYEYCEKVQDMTPVNQLQQIFSKDPREASGVWGSIRKSLQPYNDETSVKSTSPEYMPAMFNPRTFFTTPYATLYIIAPEVASEAKRMRPVFAAFLSWLVEQAQNLARETNGKLPYPVLANLDEVKNVGAIPGLAHTLSLTRSARFFVKHAWQDAAQIESAYGKDDSKTIVSNSRTWVVLPGVSDVTHLEELAKIVGEQAIRKRSRSGKGFGRSSGSSTSMSRERVAATNAAAIKALADNMVMVFSDNMAPFIVSQQRYYLHPVMVRRFKMGDARRDAT